MKMTAVSDCIKYVNGIHAYGSSFSKFGEHVDVLQLKDGFQNQALISTSLLHNGQEVLLCNHFNKQVE